MIVEAYEEALLLDYNYEFDLEHKECRWRPKVYKG